MHWTQVRHGIKRSMCLDTATIDANATLNNCAPLKSLTHFNHPVLTTTSVPIFDSRSFKTFAMTAAAGAE